MNELLVIFDVDGTLIDGQVQIVSAMHSAFSNLGLPVPERDTILKTVGLSLPDAFAMLATEHSIAIKTKLVEGYKQAFIDLRSRNGEGASPMFPGALDVVRTLSAMDSVFLGIATGKSARGLNHMLDEHGLRPHFDTLHPSDFYPSKPHPMMLEAALEDLGLKPEQAVMVGDTTYDMDMARYAKVARIGVSWGYHSVTSLIAAGAETVLTGFEHLIPYLKTTGRLQ